MDIKYKTKRKRVLKNPIKKWTYSETRLIVNYLRENERIEKPSAQLYYRRLLEQHPEINTTWDLLRYKVKNLRVTYKKARDWANGEGAKFQEMDSSFFYERLQQICPFYHELHEIFGNRFYYKIPKIVNVIEGTDLIFDSQNCDDTNQLNPIATITATTNSYPIEHDIGGGGTTTPAAAAEAASAATGIPGTSSSRKSHPPNAAGTTTTIEPIDLAKELKKLSKVALGDLYELQNSRKEELHEKLAFKEKWKNAELELEKERLQFEREKFWEEINMRKLEIQSRERIRAMEIEKDRYELELKYKSIGNNEQ